MGNAKLMKETLDHIRRITANICDLNIAMLYIVHPETLGDWLHARYVADAISKQIEALSKLWPEDKLKLAFYKASESATKLRDYIDDATDEALEEFVEELADPSTGFMNLVCGPGLSLPMILKSMSDCIPPIMPIERSDSLAVYITNDDIKRSPQAAVQQSFTIFEALLRERIGANPDIYGETLINRAFGKDGSLTYGAVPAEQQGVRNLMAGAYALFRNPRMHRITNDDEHTALAIISLVEILIRIVNEATDR